MRYKTSMTFKAECDVKYRYACIHCGHVTDWYEAKLSQIARHSQKSKKLRQIKWEHSQKALNKTADKALNRINGLVSILQNVLNDPTGEYIILNQPFVADIYNETFLHGKKCPSCETQQNWYPATYAPISERKYVKFYSIVALFLGGIVGIVFNYTILAGYENSVLYVLAFVIMFVLVGGLVGFVRATRLKNSRQPVSLSARSAPEVIWGAPTLKLIGAPVDDLEV